jgi:hypothetical protein
MHPLPRRFSLISRTQEIIVSGIRAGRWRGELPGERKLSLELQVSRWTLRAALASLDKQKVIRVAHGRRCVIVIRPSRRVARSPSRDWVVGLISPQPLWRLRPFSALCVDALRAWLQANRGDLHIYDGSIYYGNRAPAALKKLTERAPHDCWSLLLSTHAMQRWFSDRGLPAVVNGSSYEDVQLPSVDIAYRAVGRHAAGQLLGHGHRTIAWLSTNVSLAGVMECQRGFMEAFAEPQNADAELIVCQHSGTTADICRNLDRVRRRANPPTALFLQQSNSLLTTLSYLAQAGLAVPRDGSIIVGEDEPYFSHIVPQIARYSADPETLALRIGRFLRQSLEGHFPRESRAQIMPTFIPGETVVARPRNPVTG